MTPNPLDTGKAWWSDKVDLATNTLTRSVDLTGTTKPVFSFNSHWSIEQDWDYGYVEVSTDGGKTWDLLKDTGGAFTDTNPNGNSQGWGLTGEGTGTLSFDLSAYAGKQIQLRLVYSTDMATTWDGWWTDDFSVVDGSKSIFADDVENPPNGWTSVGWQVVPLTRTYPLYYLAEWRNLSGFDRGLKYPYTTIYSSATEWQVDRCPYTAPGMLLWLRNAAQSFDYTLLRLPLQPAQLRPEARPAGGGQPLLAPRVERRGDDRREAEAQRPLPAGQRHVHAPEDHAVHRSPVGRGGQHPRDEDLQEAPGGVAVPRLAGLLPGVEVPAGERGLYFWDAPASLVVPAKGDYTTKITNLDKTPATDLYGIDLGDTILGSGNPGDAGVQYGLHIAVTGKAHDGTWGMIKVWNSSDLLSLDKRVNSSKAEPGSLLTYTVKVRNLTPASQPFVLDDPIPAGTTLVGHMHDYDHATNSVHVTGTVPARGTSTIVITVRVNRDATVGTVITNTATVKDGAVGVLTDSTTTTVVKHPSRHH